LWCCKEAGIHSAELNRGAVSVPWFKEAVKSAYVYASQKELNADFAHFPDDKRERPKF
jgi:hypothetical protein